MRMVVEALVVVGSGPRFTRDEDVVVPICTAPAGCTPKAGVMVESGFGVVVPTTIFPPKVEVAVDEVAFR